MPDDEYRTKYSAAQKMQFLKTQQAKLETREIPQHTQMRLKSQDKKKKKKWKLKKKMSQTSSSSKSKRSLTSTGSSADQIRSPIPKNEIKHSVSKVEQNEELMWKHRSKYIYEAERISIKLKEIATECEKDVELRIAMDDITAGMDVLKRKRNEHCQYVNAQNDILKKQVKLLGEFQATQIIELSNKVQQLRNTMKNIDAKLSVIFTKLKSVSVQ
ncbi:unnamed protein product [Thelazia callipaeda]|uniref:Uncharacterized protein n=1 Tax=Thelazia callipaeda TaxID=103827 RepID=A0A0N5DAX4_THECL|nr:unnamed protein product [Thelazia callipaeda]